MLIMELLKANKYFRNTNSTDDLIRESFVNNLDGINELAEQRSNYIKY